eukprot:885615_1
MSNVKSEASESIFAIPDQSSSISIVKSEFVTSPQPPPAAFTCEYCGKEFNLKQYLISHVVEIHGDTCMPVKPVKREPYSARPVPSESTSGMICGESNSSAIDADILHSESGISDPKRLQCTVNDETRQNSIILYCDAERNLMNRHVDIGVKQFSCDVCQKGFSLKRNLKQHLSIHTGMKQHCCDICQKSFHRKAHLKRHVLIHSGAKPFSCEICQRSFRQKGLLNQHIFIQSGLKPHSCEICQNTFSRKGDLKRLRMIHSGTKQFSCE